ncbi:hypothetical protein PENTCL1PPCAC_15889, partial [Pristionchus entomophagus]
RDRSLGYRSLLRLGRDGTTFGGRGLVLAAFLRLPECLHLRFLLYLLLGYHNLLLLDYRILSLLRPHGNTERRGRRRRGGGDEGPGGVSASVALTGSGRRSSAGAHNIPAHVVFARSRHLHLAMTPLLLLLLPHLPFLLLLFLLLPCLLFVSFFLSSSCLLFSSISLFFLASLSFFS